MRKKNLTGFSHGAAGIALALYKLGHITGNEEFKRTAHQALLFEREMFCPKRQN